MNSSVLGWVVAAVVIVIAGAWYLSHPSPHTSGIPIENEPVPVAQPQAQHENVGDPLMSGLWQSTTDKKFTREIRPDGVMIDRYEGDMGAGTGGEWSVVDPKDEAPIASRASALSGMTVIKVIWDGGVEVTYFAVNKLDEKSLTTTDLSGKGDVTIYSKVTSA